MTRILVTGGAGYVGSHCCKALAEAGFEPVVFDNLSMGHESAVRWGPLIKGDMRDAEALLAAIRETRPEAVLHFAALALVGESTAHPERYYAVNVGGTLNLLEAMRAGGVSAHRLLLDLRDLRRAGARADHRRPAATPDQSLRRDEACLRMDDGGFRPRARAPLRAACATSTPPGADPAAEIGEWHEPETHLIPLVLDAALGRARRRFPSSAPTIRRRRHRAARLHPCHRSRRRACRRAPPSAGGRRLRRAQSRHRARRLRARGYRARSRTPPAGAFRSKKRRGAPATRRSSSPIPSRAEALLGWRAAPISTTIVEDAWRWHLKRSRPRLILRARPRLSNGRQAGPLWQRYVPL